MSGQVIQDVTPDELRALAAEWEERAAQAFDWGAKLDYRSRAASMIAQANMLNMLRQIRMKP